jgi:hypothetical protein
MGSAQAARGPLFEGTRHSLQSYRIPDWFRDAKFGIWAHWGPQSAIEQGDWYARNMYMQGSEQYRYHVEHYGHPTKVGYKDLVGDWKAAKWDPDHLMDLYKKAGAKYFVSMGVHHDNFDLWDSKYNRWNAAKMGPMKDVVGTWASCRAQPRPALRRQRAPVDQLQVVGRQPRLRQVRVPLPASLTTAPIPTTRTSITTPTPRASTPAMSNGTTMAFPIHGSAITSTA